MTRHLLRKGKKLKSYVVVIDVCYGPFISYTHTQNSSQI